MMKFSFDTIKEYFGSKDRNISRLILTLAVNHPNITSAQIFEIFKTSLDSYMTKVDDIIDKTTWINQQYSGRTMLDISENPSDPKQNLHTTFIFKNLYRVIDQTTEWNEQLSKPVIANKLMKEKEQLIKKLKLNYRDTVLQDKFEIVCEFIELVEKKRKVLSELKNKKKVSK